MAERYSTDRENHRRSNGPRDTARTSPFAHPSCSKRLERFYLLRKTSFGVAFFAWVMTIALIGLKVKVSCQG